jgi:hypothetical protein
MSDWPDHHCPGCGVARKPFPRYPWHLCNACCDLACDAEGRKLVFGNASASGGFVWGYADEDMRYSSIAVLCLIKSRPVVVGEARFGGVVAQPYLGQKRGLLDLRKPNIDRETLQEYPPMRRGRAP